MGVPAFFRWLCKKYPSIVTPAKEEKAKTDPSTDAKVPVDTSAPNPNGVEFDNLYLDMNGIIHPCTHPEDRPAPKNEEEMMVIIFEFIDRIFSIVRPRKLLYMAIDGVAPRAKMNQQRSRRFRAAKDSIEKASEIKRLRDEIVANGGRVPPEVPQSEKFDSNCITPGTPFMFKLADCLRYYIHDRLNSDPGWKNLTVILSDANVPGEGEHKIMDYIRRQRANPDHDPNTHHVLCGADADLIMLGLATHEPHFTIIREEFKPDRPRPCEVCSQYGHETKECMGLDKVKASKNSDYANTYVPTETRFIFLRLSILREYLTRDLAMTDLPFQFDIERAIDDWVFLCFFVGNDFLPHLPSLEIREGAIDRLVTLYKRMINKAGGYLTDSGDVHLERVQFILSCIGQVEDGIFKKRQQSEIEFRNRRKQKKRMEDELDKIDAADAQLKGLSIHDDNQNQYGSLSATNQLEADESTNANKLPIEAALPVLDDAVETPTEEEVDEDANDPVKLWEDGWKERYYRIKFDVCEYDEEFRTKLAHHYTIGLQWVLKYYYQGVPSWNWYFPYHFAPFASDFVDIVEARANFEENSEPFRPFDQLMAVFPAASKKHVPLPWQPLMTDPKSPIIDFYPNDFQVDLNGKKMAWQGVALLPFVDEERLKSTLEPYLEKLTAAEKKRNTRGNDCFFVGKDHKLYPLFKELYRNRNGRAKNIQSSLELSTSVSGGIAGKIWCDPKVVLESETFVSPIRYLCQDIANNQVLSVCFHDPLYESDFVFKPVILSGAKMPEATLKPRTMDPNRPYRPRLGFNQQNDYRSNKDPSVANRMIQNSMGGISSVNGDHFENQGPSQRNNNYQGRSGYNNNRYNNNNNNYGNNNFSRNQNYNNGNNNYGRQNSNNNSRGGGGANANNFQQLDKAQNN